MRSDRRHSVSVSSARDLLWIPPVAEGWTGRMIDIDGVDSVDGDEDNGKLQKGL